MARAIFTNGEDIKSINPWTDDPQIWSWFTGLERGKQDQLYASVAAMYRAHNLKANTISSIPFDLLDKSGEVYDTSDKWENKVGFLPNPQELIRLNVLSVMATNTIYMLRTTDALGYKTRGLYHAVPYNFNPRTNPAGTQLDYIERKVGGTLEKYQPEDKRLIWMWRLDHTTELLPSPNTESQAIASSAGIIYHADFWIGNFFRRGGIKPTLIAMKGLIDKDNKEEKEKSWSNWLNGIGRAGRNIARIFNAETIDPKQIGSGVDDMKDNKIYEQAIANIAMGTGMPLSLLLANSANKATAMEEKSTWYESDIVPFLNWFAYEYNRQLFEPLNLRLNFRPETLDPNQEDETERASAINTFIDFLTKCPTYDVFLGTAQTFGYELSDTLIEAAQSYFAEKNKPVEVAPTQPQTQPEQQPSPPPAKWIPSLDELEELRVWREVATRRFKKGESLVFEYLPHYGGLPDNVTADVSASLSKSWDWTNETIKQVFDVSRWVKEETSEIKLLADSINRLADSMKG